MSNARLSFIPLFLIASPGHANAEIFKDIQSVKAETADGVCVAGNMTQLRVTFVTKADNLDEDEESYVVRTGQDAKSSNINFSRICLNDGFQKLDGRFLAAKDNLIAAHNLCLTKAAK